MPNVCRLLFVGDIHLGRRPSGLPTAIAHDDQLMRQLTPAAAWEGCVAAAIEQAVDVVVLAGDVVDDIDDRFEAHGQLERGVTRLQTAGVQVLAVAGNHDVKVLPRLSDQIPAFRLLGRGGNWETLHVQGRGGGRVHLVGWSFPREKVLQSPLGELRVEHDPAIATLGVLHCDVGVANSVYAPVARSELESAPVAAWFLGHVHKPSISDDSRPIGYLGSLTAMDPGEPGVHGPWLVEVDGARITTCRQLPLAPLRFESEDVPLDGIDTTDAEELEQALTSRILEALHRVAQRAGVHAIERCRLVSCRLALVGRSRHHREIRTLLARTELAALERSAGSARICIERILDNGEPAIDLASLARERDPPGLIAQDILELSGDSAVVDELLRGATAALERAAASGDFAMLGSPPFNATQVREYLTRAACLLLEDVIGIKHPTGATP